MWFVLFVKYSVEGQSHYNMNPTFSTETFKYWEMITFYFSLATIHGLNYVAELKMNFLKMFWGLLIISFFLFSMVTSIQILEQI